MTAEAAAPETVTVLGLVCVRSNPTRHFVGERGKLRVSVWGGNGGDWCACLTLDDKAFWSGSGPTAETATRSALGAFTETLDAIAKHGQVVGKLIKSAVAA